MFLRRLTLLAVVLLSLASLPLAAHAQRIVTREIPWKEVGILAPRDTVFMNGASDTTRTVAIDTSDWDWNAIIQQQVASGYACRVTFSSVLNNGVTDSLYYEVETNSGFNGGPTIQGTAAGAAPDTMFTYNGTLAAAVGSVALGTLTPFSNSWTGYLVALPNSNSVNNVWMVKKFRLRVSGDVSGTTPKVSQLRCFITYPQRANAVGTATR